MPMFPASFDRLCMEASTGDALIFGGRPLAGITVERFTKSKQSHCAPIIRDKDNLYCPESLGRGMNMSPLEKTFFHWPRVWWLHPRDRLFTPPAEALAEKVCQERVPYDYRALLLYYRGIRPPEDMTHLYCSEWLALFLRTSGVTLPTISLTPIETCMMAVWQPQYWCIRFKRREGPLEIRDFNTLDPTVPLLSKPRVK